MDRMLFGTRKLIPKLLVEISSIFDSSCKIYCSSTLVFNSGAGTTVKMVEKFISCSSVPAVFQQAER